MAKLDLDQLHSCSSQNRHAIEASDNVGCFHCERIWDPLQFPIKEWIDEHPSSPQPCHPGFPATGNATAMCPFCGIDSILAKLSVGDITVLMLDQMRRKWFDK